MTTLQFTGVTPLWLGLLLAGLAGVLSWRYYRRESFELTRRLRWLLPLLRSLAFFLGVMLLTGPVLHHRQTIGELGRVQIYLDGSNSMTLLDRQMSLVRKLKVSEQLGWLPAGSIDWTPIDLADEIAAGTDAALQALPSQPSETEPADSAELGPIAAQLLAALRAVEPRLPPGLADELRSAVLEPLEDMAGGGSADEAELRSLVSRCSAVEQSLRSAVEQSIAERLAANDAALQSALTQFDAAPRWRRAECGMASSPANVLDRLRQRHDVRLLQLAGETAVPLELNRDAAGETLAADALAFGSTTDLGSGPAASQAGLARTADASAAPQPQTAVVLVTDGQHNSGPSPLQMARLLGEQGVAVYCVATGATQPAPDLAVTGIEHPELVLAKDRVRGVITLRDTAPPGTPFLAQISAGEEVLWQQQLLTQNVAERRVEFEFGIEALAARAGDRIESDVRRHVLPLALSVSVSQLADEAETDNNERTMRLAAILETDRILILDGRSRWETRYLRNAFERDERWQVNTIVAGPAADTPALPRGDQEGQFPLTREALFDYQLVIFGEIDPGLFAPHELQWLREFVEIRGGGLIFIDGSRGALRRLTEQDLASLLPVHWSPAAIEGRPAALQLTDKGAAESALRLQVEETANREFWTKLPPPQWLAAVEAAPAAEIMVAANVNGRSLPAIVTQRFGAGRVLYFAFDETWRWRYKAADVWHQRVWNQLARFVMPRPFAVSDNYVSLDTGAVSHAVGDAVDIRVKLLGLDGKPTSEATADALIWKDGEIVATVGLTADPDVPGLYRGRSAGLSEGDYEVSVRAAGYSESALAARTEFVVQAPESGEMVETGVNAELLKQIAEASGGVYLREEELSKLPELLDPLSSGRVVESDTVLWQSYWWFAAMLLLLTLEWLLRKRAGLL